MRAHITAPGISLASRCILMDSNKVVYQVLWDHLGGAVKEGLLVRVAFQWRVDG